MASLRDRVVATIDKKFGKGSATVADQGRARSEVTKVVPFGITPLDHYVLGCGGLPCGRMTELFSEEGGGKSSLVYAALAGAQRAGGIGILIESEASFTAERAQTFGVDLSSLILLEAAGDSSSLTIEGVMARLEIIAKQTGPEDGPVLVAWDSLAATPTAAEVENGLVGDEKVADRAKILSRACRVLAGLASKHQIAFLIVNQTRASFGGGWGASDVTTPGGAAVRFYASLRLRIMGGAAVKDGERHVGKDLTVMAVKNKMAPPWRKCRVRLSYADGWDNDWSTVSAAKEAGLVSKASRFTGPAAEAARIKLLEHYRDNPNAAPTPEDDEEEDA